MKKQNESELKAMRIGLGYTQNEVADIMGISRYTVINMENGISIKESTINYYEETLSKLQGKTMANENECTFCSLNALENYNQIARLPINAGDLGMDLAVELWYSKTDNNESTIDMVVNSGRGTLETATPINFCPICGRNLRR